MPTRGVDKRPMCSRAGARSLDTMNLVQKLLMAAAVASVLLFIIRKAMAYQRAEREEILPVLQPVREIAPRQREPVRRKDLRVVRNAPL